MSGTELPGASDLCEVLCSALVAHNERTKMEDFVVKHYSSEERPTLKGNGFDGFEVGADREEAQAFADFVNALRKDAERYRWLRGPDAESTRYSRWRVEFFGGQNGWEPMQRERMDAAIDAAMRASAAVGAA